MDNDENIRTLLELVEDKLGIRATKRLFCILLLVFGVDRKAIIEKIGVSRFSINKFGEAIESGNIGQLFCDNVYRRKSEMEYYRDEIMAELDKTPARTLREAAVIIERVSGLKRSLPQVMKFLKKTDTKR